MEIKVYGGLVLVKGQQVRAIVAAKNKKCAAELVGEKYAIFLECWSETKNEIELQFATSKPGCVFMASTSMGCDFTPSNALLYGERSESDLNG